MNAIFPKTHSLRKSLLLSNTLVSLVLDSTQMVLAVRKHLEMAIIIILNNPAQPLLMQIFQKFTLWGSPWSCPTPWCLWGWTSPRWSWLRVPAVAFLLISSHFRVVLFFHHHFQNFFHFSTHQRALVLLTDGSKRQSVSDSEGFGEGPCCL